MTPVVGVALVVGLALDVGVAPVVGVAPPRLVYHSTVDNNHPTVMH